MVKAGANPLQKNPSSQAGSWKLHEEDEKIEIPYAGRCAATFACAILKALQASPHADRYRKCGAIDFYQRVLTEMTTQPAKIVQNNISVPQSVVDTWESAREMTSTHNVIFETADDEVSAHDFILMTASPVLKAMLQATMKEGLSKRISVKDSSSSGVRLFVDMLYTSSTRDDPDYKTVLVALDLAHRWQANGVVPVLSGILPEMIAVDSFAGIAEAAVLKGLEPLQQECRSFGASNAKIKTMLKKGTLPAEVRKLLGEPAAPETEQGQHKRRRTFAAR